MNVGVRGREEDEGKSNAVVGIRKGLPEKLVGGKRHQPHASGRSPLWGEEAAYAKALSSRAVRGWLEWPEEGEQVVKIRGPWEQILWGVMGPYRDLDFPWRGLEGWCGERDMTAFISHPLPIAVWMEEWRGVGDRIERPV